jgi:hypothetical protein
MNGRDESCIKIWLGSLKGYDHLGEIGIDERIVLSLTFIK